MSEVMNDEGATLRDRHARKILGAGWIVDQFKGTYTVSFSCPGSVASRATFSVNGAIGHPGSNV